MHVKFTGRSYPTFAGLFWKQYDIPDPMGVAIRFGLCGDR